MASLAINEELDRSASPPGRETRDDWRDESARNGRSRSPLAEKRHSRSRSPVRRGGRRPSPSREMRYAREGTNTTSREPHLERARLFVGNIEPNRTHRRDLVKLFSNYGDVLGVSIHKGYAFVQMDRERSANKAINFEDDKTFMGARIHVEFSQAALKAGAKFERLQRSPPPPPSRERYPYPPEPYYIEDQERQREERLERILQMEREIALLRSNELDSRKPPQRLLDSHHDSYDRRGGGGNGGGGGGVSGAGYHRRSPPLNYDSYPREREPYRERGGVERGPMGGGVGRGGMYSRLSPVSSGDRGGDGYREPVAYPSQYTGSSGRNPSSVGYSSQSSKGSGGGSGLPPGWPSGIHEKSNANRPPFTNTGPWS